MKKLISLLLALVMCLGMLAACTGPVEPQGTPAATVADAKDYLYAMYKDSAVTVTRGFSRVAVVAIDGVSYPITWTVDNELVTVTQDATMATITITEKPEEAYEFVLTATIADAEGKTETLTFNHAVDAVASTGVIFAETPVAGVAYKYAVQQNGLSTPATIYFTGKMSGNYLATSQNALDAVDVFVEEVEGGYNVYFMDGEAKKYIVITTYVNAEGVTKKTQKIADEPGAVYVWDKERGAMIANVEGIGECYLGCYGTYTTISASEATYIADVTKIGVSQFPAGFATVTASPAKELATGKAYLFALQQNALETPTLLYLTGKMSGNYLATSSSLSDAVRVYLEETEGGYYLVCLVDGAKKYINITTYTKDDGSLKNTQKIEDAPSVPYTWDAERATFVADLGEVGQFYLGTYNTYTTMSTSNVSYISDVTKIGVSQFPAGLYEIPNLPAEDINPAPAEEVDLTTPAGIVAAAYALEAGEALEGEFTLEGVITSIPTEYSEQYGNITVVIVVDGLTEKPIECFRLKGDGAADLKVGDKIKVTGVLKNYNGKIEFDSGCKLG